ncbi:hypothetical protein Pyn_41215 [Prunus yedoensis var. nudiflora]|uniref:Uncharacterized protein n=1 Tax=Prunus yedoensis var. nudiflora TaxID=2094558 RepID=A0A314U9A1_PRUYE|nr:hypothetical protein Pyn_41215 [Prunus yedoensis var. nudiflora]
MANPLSTLPLMALLSLSAAAATRTKLQPTNNVDGGICKSLVETQGYACEEHKVTTADGYVLGLQRIPAGRSGCLAWLLNEPDKALAFILAYKGFDVWLANACGTESSRGHTSLSPNDPAYWDWSWDELTAYDLLAAFQYVNNQTGQKLHYVGHSLGTLTALAAFSQEKLLNLLRSAALLSPIAYLGQISRFGRTTADIFLAQAQIVVAVLQALMLFVSIRRKLFRRMVRKGTIEMYDYGLPITNMQHYRQPTPPVYNMANIPKDVPLFLSYGGRDRLSNVFDVNLLLDNLKDHDKDKLVVQFREDYAQMDFIMAMNANQVVYDPLLSFFRLH